MVYIGADTCRAGWFAVSLTEGTDYEVNVFPDIFSLWNQCRNATLILLDIPIGLRENGFEERSCDKKARKLLGPKRGCSVFPAPCRSAIGADTYEDGSEINEKMTGRKLSKQIWGIISKIKEVDQLLSSDIDARSRIREIHPEVCFWALNNGEAMKLSKKKWGGYLERRKVLLSVYPYTEVIVNDALRKYPLYKVARDDILDALVAAVTSSKGIRGLLFIPETVEFDSKGLPMQMGYCPINKLEE